MAPKKELLQLFRSIATVDWQEAKRAASSIADSEAQRGHHALAAQLKSILATQRPTGSIQGELFQSQSDNGTFTLNALSALHSPVGLHEVALPARARSAFVSLLKEHRHQAELIAKGVNPRRRILLYGPPGCGKSMTARALATELGLPVFVVRLDAIVGAYLGQTASRVRELFRFAETINCVLLLDEVDALGKSRGAERDIGELDRVAISLIQELEHAQPKGLLVATSNLEKSLDRALLRRFDFVQGFKAPSQSELVRFARQEAERKKLSVTPALLHAARRSRSYAGVVGVVADCHRESILRRFK